MSKVDDVLLRLPGEHRAALLDVLRDPTVSATLIARAVTDAGYPMERKAVRRWREKRGVR